MKRHAPEERELDAGPLFRSLPIHGAGTNPPSFKERAGPIVAVQQGLANPGSQGVGARVLGSREEAARRRDEGIANAATSADARAREWAEQFVEAVRTHALTHRKFLAEDVLELCPVPHGVNPKSTGALMRRARAAGFIVAIGFAPAKSSNLSAKVEWLSLIYAEVSA